MRFFLVFDREVFDLLSEESGFLEGFGDQGAPCVSCYITVEFRFSYTLHRPNKMHDDVRRRTAIRMSRCRDA